jgi:gliding motility-associated-like protein
MVSANGCVGVTVSIQNQSGNNLSINFGDGTGWTVSTQHIYSQPGTYSIAMIFGAGHCSDTVSESILIHPQPEAGFVMSSYSLCNGESTTPVDTAATTPSDSIVWIWRGDASPNPPTIVGDNSTLFVTTEWVYLQVHSVYCGYAVDSHAVTMFPIPVTKAGLNYTGHCTPLPLSFANNSQVPPGTTYQWYLNGQPYSTDSIPQATILTADTSTVYYTFVLAAITRCDTVFDTVDVYVDPPSFTIALEMTDTSACQNVALHFANDMPAHYTLVYYPAPGAVFTTHGDTSVTYYYSQPGTYNVTVVVSNGCAFDTAYHTVVILPIPQPNPTFSGGSCLDSIVTFNSGVPATNTVGVLWNFGDGTINSSDLNPSHEYVTEGNYSAYVLVTGSNFCISDTAFFNVQISKAPQASLRGDTLLCTPTDVWIQADSLRASGVIYRFYIEHDSIVDSTESVSGGFLFNYQDGGEYFITVRAMDANNPACNSLAGTYKVTVIETPTAYFDVNGLMGGSVIKTYETVNRSSGASDYDWDFSDGYTTNMFEPTHTYHQAGNYTIQLVASYLNCPDTFARKVFVDPDLSFFIPNIFSPNGDGSNDFFQIFGDLPLFYYFNVQVFNRIGEKVFEDNKAPFKWDGTYKGVMQSPQVFVYQIKYAFKQGEVEALKKGSITLVR